ncbi:MAG TPA: hypothetical protein VF895_04770 [Gaiellaceae bacterium]
MKKLVLALTTALLGAVLVTAAAAGPPPVVKSKQITLKPSGITIRLVASKTNLDQKRAGRVALWLTLYRKTGPGFKKVKQVKVTTGFKLSSRLKSLVVVQAKGPQYRNTAEVHLKWFVSPSVGTQTWSFVATPKQLAPQE